jgi:Acetyltransferase (GNAT) domain
VGPWTRNPKASIGYWRLFRDPPRFCSDHPDGTIEVGNWFGVDYQGKGYASEALRATLDQIATDPDLAHRSSLLNVDPTMRPQSGFWPRPAFTRQAVQALALTGSNLPSGKDRLRGNNRSNFAKPHVWKAGAQGAAPWLVLLLAEPVYAWRCGTPSIKRAPLPQC